MAKYRIEERPTWRWWVTPKPLRAKPIHRWCVFPHSFTSELVHGLIDEWGLTASDKILDPFCGAGTTPLAAKERNIPATGYDLSPFAVFATRVKLNDYDPDCLLTTWKRFQKRIDPSKWNGALRDYPNLIKKALPGHLLGAFDNLINQIVTLNCPRKDRDFLKMALLATLPDFSRAVATGGWLKWMDQRTSTRQIPGKLAHHVEVMLADIGGQEKQARDVKQWIVRCADARQLPDSDSAFSAVITSPPYPNRHDYTRVFGVELMFGFLDWTETKKLRYQSFESHPEAKPQRPDNTDYAEPKLLTRTLKRMAVAYSDPRIPDMLRGYFLDMFLTLREVHRVCRDGARIAFVVGNAQYGGIPVLVDELTAQIGEQVGLRSMKIVAIRYRGNSAQQMREHGRKPARESIVLFKVSRSGGRP